MKLRPDAAAYARAALAGAVPALAVEVALLLAGGRFFAYEPLGDVFDAQARSLLDGRWDVPPDVVKIEGFLIGGKTYTYFGPFPAVLRMPVVAFTSALDGRLTRLSMVVACAVTLTIVARLLLRGRRVHHGEQPPDGQSADGAPPVRRVEQIAVASVVFLVGGASSVTYLASRPGVFHEAIAWGVATALVGLEMVLRWRDRPTALRLAIAVVAATVALLTRASIGAAPAMALGLYALADLVGASRARSRDGRRAGRAIVAGALVLVPLAAYGYVNYAKFGTVGTLPYNRHIVSMVNEHRKEVLAANHGTIQGLQFLPTTALHYVRPDAIGVDGAYPWIDFPRAATVVGGVVMDATDAATSVPDAMPALTVLAVVGGVVMIRDRRRRAAWWPVVAAAGGSLVVTLAIGFVAHRYTADAVPLLVIGAAAGLPAVIDARRGWRTVTLATGAVLGVASLLITAALTIQFQQHYGFLTTAALREKLARTQLDLPWAGGPEVRRAALGHRLPSVGRDRTFLVVGPCAGLYRSDGQAWQPVERTPATGRWRVALDPRVVPHDGSGYPLVAGIRLRRDAGDLVVTHGDRASRPIHADADRDGGMALVLDVVADRLLGVVEVRAGDGRLLLDDFLLGGGGPDAVVTASGVDLLPTPTPVCDELRVRVPARP